MTKKPRKPEPGKSLDELYPTVAQQWHPEKNGTLSPSEVLPGSNVKVWWRCEKGHEWKAIVQSRLRSQKCPFCIGRHVSSDNCLAVTHPQIAAEWHPSKNGNLNPKLVSHGQNKTAWWLCEKGHEWRSQIKNRTSGYGCPYCSGRSVGKDNNFAVVFPDVAKEWHSKRNGEITPGQVAPKSNKKVWWLCEHGHEWQAKVAARSNGSGCPICGSENRRGPHIPPFKRSLKFKNPTVAAEWHPTKNGDLKPSQVYPGSKSRYWWLCKKGHEWKTSVTHRNRGSGCPYCARTIVDNDQSLLRQEPELCKQWHPTKNAQVDPSEVSPGSGRIVWWRCDKGHEWKARIHKRVTGHGCPYCSGRKVGADNNLQVVNPHLASQWHPTRNEPLASSDVTPNSSRKVWWLCNYQHEWEATVSNRSRGSGCPLCTSQTSRPEIRIYSELASIFGNIGRRERIFGTELDIYIPKLNLGIEYDGVYYHAAKIAQDKKKNELLNSRGISVIRVREKPLCKISDWDVICSPGELKKGHVDQILLAIRDLCNKPERQAVDEYLAASKFRANSTYRKVLSYLPGPPPEDSLASIFPEFARLWHTKRNFPLTPDQFLPKSQKKVWWRCEKGHEWNTSIAQLTESKGCPYCLGRRVGHDNNLAAIRPEIAHEWHPEKNGSKLPTGFTVGSRARIWWQCSRGHEWQTTIVSRTNGQGCPYCVGRLASEVNNLAVLNPNLAIEWHDTKNGEVTPRDVTQFSNQKVWWRCKRGHEWRTSVAARSSGTGCPYCSGNRVSEENCLAAKYPSLLPEWNKKLNLPLRPTEVTAGSDRKVWWKCRKGHEWKAAVGARTRGSGCPECRKTKRKKKAV